MNRPDHPAAYRIAAGIRPYSLPWETFSLAIRGIPLPTAEHRAMFKRISGGVAERPGLGWDEAFANAGRGAGKDDTIASEMSYECRYGQHELAAAYGQRITARCIAPFRDQANSTVRMVQGEANLPFNKKHVARQSTDSVDFSNGTAAVVQTADQVGVAGPSNILAVINECSLMPGDESATPFRLILQNIYPTLRRMEGAPHKRLIHIGSSYVTEGVSWEMYRDCFGKEDSDILVVRGPTDLFNPNIDKAWLAQQRTALIRTLGKERGEAAYEMHFGEDAWQDSVARTAYAIDDIAHSAKARPGNFRDGRYVIAVDPIKDLNGESPDKCGVTVLCWRYPSAPVELLDEIFSPFGEPLPGPYAGCKGWVGRVLRDGDWQNVAIMRRPNGDEEEFDLEEYRKWKSGGVDIDNGPYLHIAEAETFDSKTRFERIGNVLTEFVRRYRPSMACLDYGGDTGLFVSHFKKLGLVDSQIHPFSWHQEQRRAGFEWVGRLLADRRLHCPKEALRKDLLKVQSMLDPAGKVKYTLKRTAEGHCDLAATIVTYAIAECESLVQESPYKPANYRMEVR